jgi:CMP-N-acetylneuraminic acid synthetase
VTVYIPSRTYGRFLVQAIDSVLGQTLDDWELIIIDDGSEDETATVAARYQQAQPDRILVLRNDPPKGITTVANQALETARGQYVLRLDADDYLDENALLVLSAYLDRHPDVALVYPNYICADEQGRWLGVEHRKRIGAEVELLDLPAHGACTLVRKRILKAVGGYDQQWDRQDGYDLWLKIASRYPVANVSTPLFFYRQHERSLTRNEKQLLEVRGSVKRLHVERRRGPIGPRIAAIIPAKNTYPHMPDEVLTPVAGRPLIDYTLDAARELRNLSRIIVTTDDSRVAEYCRPYPDIGVRIRPENLLGSGIHLSNVTSDAVTYLEREEQIFADIILVLSVHTPLRGPEHIRAAIDTLLLYDTDSVISVYEARDVHYLHGRNGLEPLNPGMDRELHLERETLYVDNLAVRVLWRDVLTETDMTGRRVGHVLMPYADSFRIRSQADLWLLEQFLTGKLSQIPTQAVNLT